MLARDLGPTCAYLRCETRIGDGQLACLTHWRSLPMNIRRRIEMAWARRKRNPGNEALVGAHLEAVREAMAYWHGVST